MLQRVEIRHFAEGRRGDRNPSDLPEGACPSGSNVTVDRDSIKVRPGYVVHSAWPAAPATGATALALYLPTADCAVTTKRFVAGMADGTVYSSEVAGETFGGAPMNMNPATAWSANRKRFAQFGKHMYAVDGSGPVRRFFNLGGALESDVEELESYAEMPATDLTLVATAGADVVEHGPWQIAWCYARLDYSDEGPLRIQTLVVPPATANIDITIPDENMDGILDRAHVYAKAPSSDTFYRVATWLVVPGTHNFTITTSGSSNPHPGFWPSPPQAATLLIEHWERMVYAAPYQYSRTGTADTLYISRLGDPTHCTIDPVAYPTDEEGAWVQVGEDGGAITGLAKLGAYLVATKALGVWALAWNGPQDFLLSPVSTLAGCAAHETLVNVEGVLFWLGHDTVWRMDGGFGITDIGQPVADLIAAYTATQRQAAFAAFDPVNRRYLIGFNDGAWLSYNLKTGKWDPPWAGLADGCMLWAQGATTPGLYAGTETGAAGDGIWRLTGTVDGDDEAIAFSWDSPEFDVPAGRYKDIGRVDVTVLDCDLLGASGNINDASNGSPIIVTTVAAHGLSTGDRVRVAGVTGNTAANGDWTVTFVAATQVSLDGSTGNGVYAGGGTLQEILNRVYGALLRNGDTAEYASQELVPAADADTPQALRWCPAPVGDADRYQLRVRGTAKDDLEIGTCVLHVKDVGGI